MTTTHTNLALVEGEVYILSSERINENDHYLGVDNKPHLAKEGLHYMAMAKNLPKIIASTAKLEGIPQLDRKHFVKPKVDVGAKATEIFESSHLNLSTDFIIGYRFGHTDRAKEAEFTREDMEKAIDLAFTHGRHLNTSQEKITHGIFQVLMPDISLPKSVTLNENNEVISVEW